MEFSKDLNAASATPLILALLREKPRYGYALIRDVETLSDGRLRWEEGMLYPILHRLEALGWVTSDWSSPRSGRKRKYYSLQPEGHRALQSSQEQWQAMHAILQSVWTGASSPRSEVFGYDERDEDDDVLPVSLL